MSDSFILSKIYALWHFIIKSLSHSKIIMGIFCFYQRILKSFDESTIVSGFVEDWGMSKVIDESAFIGKKTKFDGGKISKYLNESFILKIILDVPLPFVMLCFLGFVFPFVPTMLFALLIVVLLMCVVIKRLSGRVDVLPKTGIDFFVGLFVLALFIGAVISTDLVRGLTMFAMYFVLISIYKIVGYLIESSRQLWIFINSVIAGGFLISLHGIYQYFVGVPMDAAWIDETAYDITTRVYSVFGNPNVLGEYLIVMTMLGVGLFFASKKIVFKGVYGGVIMTNLLCLMFTSSRGSWLGVALGLGIFVILVARKLIPLGIAGILSLPFILPYEYLVRLMSITNFQDTSNAYRISIWTATIDMIQNYWLTGIGLGSFIDVYPLFSFSAAYAYHAHNTYLQIFLNLGIVGFAVFFIALFLYIQNSLHAYKNATYSYRAIIIASLAGSMGLWLQGMVDHIWFNYKILLLFWLSIGITMVSVRLSEKGEESFD